MDMVHLLLTMTLFLAPTHPQLNESSDSICPCAIVHSDTQETIDKMLELAAQVLPVGLAAPQIGIQERIILVDLAATGIFTPTSQRPSPQFQVYINPEILWKSDEIVCWREGCFSTANISGIVPRSNRILIRAYDREGNLLCEEFTGYTARIFQHEIDHLDGIRFPEHIKNDADLHWVEPEELPAYRIHWASWQKTCPRELWLEMKSGTAR